MTYIILRNTFGDDLKTISNIGLDVIDENQLDEDGQYASIEDYHNDGNTPMSETLVICKILGEIDRTNVGDYIDDVLIRRQEEKTKRNISSI